MESNVPQTADIWTLSQEIENFRQFALEHGNETQKETFETSYINIFWQDIFTQLQMEIIPIKYFQLKYADVDSSGHLRNYFDKESPQTIPVLFLAYEPIYFTYEQEIRKAGRVAKLSLGDIHREIRRERYWIRPLKKQTSHRISINTNRMTCWCVDLNEHPIGQDILEYIKSKMSSTPSLPEY